MFIIKYINDSISDYNNDIFYEFIRLYRFFSKILINNSMIIIVH